MFRYTSRLLKPPQLFDGFPTNFETIRIPQSNGAGPATQGGNPRLITPRMLMEFNPHPRVLEFAKKEKIAFPTALRLVPGQNFKDFPMKFLICQRNVFSYYHLKYLSVFEHPLTEKTLHFYAQKKHTRPLWCYVQGSSAKDGSKVVVRAASERMVMAALCRALEASGYNGSGWSVDKSRKPLRGTIRILVNQPKDTLKIDFDRLVAYLTKLVSDAVPRLGGASAPPK